MTVGLAAADTFCRLFDTRPAGLWAAPGRVNVIGEHTDYNEGFVLPFAIQHQVVVAAGPARSAGSRAHSIQQYSVAAFSVADVRPGGVRGWGAYVAGVLWALREAGHEIGDVDVVVDGRVPLGAGLSSSAALGCSVAVAVSELFELDLSRTDLAVLTRSSENDFVGAPTGGMDQMASMHGRAGQAVFVDTRTNVVELVPLPFGDELQLLVIDTHVHHELVDSEYATRRASCMEGARLLGVPALRDIMVDQLPAALSALDDEVTRRRVRHVVTEDARVLATVEGLRTAADPVSLGSLLTESHASMRDDYEITTPELDQAVTTAVEAGAFGARMTGGGFGGSVIALVTASGRDDVAQAVADVFAASGWTAPDCFVAMPSDGAHRVG